MADLVFNQAKGKAAEWAARVNANDPTNSVLVIEAINAGAMSDATAKDYDTFAQIEADANAAEVTNSGYARKVLDQSASITITVDDTNDRTDVDFPDQTWTAVAAGSAWTDIVVGYDSDSTGGTDANIVPISQHDFAITPDGSDITMQVAAAGFFRAS